MVCLLVGVRYRIARETVPYDSIEVEMSIKGVRFETEKRQWEAEAAVGGSRGTEVAQCFGIARVVWMLPHPEDNPNLDH